MFGWFRRKPEPPTPPRDERVWNEDWQVGDTAECIVDGIRTSWRKDIPPWERPAFGQRLVVAGFKECPATDNSIRYFLVFVDWPCPMCTEGFRKVRPVATEQSEFVQHILTAKPGIDRVREPAHPRGDGS